jgi:chromate transporter
VLRKTRNIIFLRDVFILALTAFGGPQAHIALFLDVLVKKRAYLSEEELIELNALCQVLPGPTSTQTVTAIGYQKGGANLAYLTLIVWCFPAISLMAFAGVFISYWGEVGGNMAFAKYVLPIAVGFVAYAAIKISSKVVQTNLGGALMVLSAVASYFIQNPWIFPALILTGALLTAWKYKQQPKEEKEPLKFKWGNLVVFILVLAAAALLGAYTKSRFVLLFENFYRNGTIIFGGGQVLIPYLHTEFVEFKSYLSSSEFLTGWGFVQAVPGPVFSFTAFIGALSVREYGILGELFGAFLASAGIFLPGTFMIFFAIGVWAQLKKYRIVRASLEGINAAASGMILAAALILFDQIPVSIINMGLILLTYFLLAFSRVPSPVIIIAGILLGIFF